MNKADLNVWQLAAKIKRMDAEIGELWKLVNKVTGRTVPPPDPRQLALPGTLEPEHLAPISRRDLRFPPLTVGPDQKPVGTKSPDLPVAGEDQES